MYIYCVTNNVNDKVYVGMTSQRIQQRFSEHLKHAKRQETALDRAILKYGPQAFSIRKLAEATSLEELGQLERRYIAELQSTSHHRGYNIADGGIKTQLGAKRSEATKQKIREANLGRKHTAETRAKMSAERKGRIPKLHLDQMRAIKIEKTKLQMLQICGPDHCKGKNLYINSRDEICCRACRSRTGKARYKPKGDPRKTKIALICGPGHRKGKNLYISPSGRRACRACQLRHVRAYQIRKGTPNPPPSA